MIPSIPSIASHSDGRISGNSTDSMIADRRILAPYYANETDGGRIDLYGDSMMFQLDGLNLVMNDGSVTSFQRTYCPELVGRGVSIWNHGANGQTMTAWMAGGGPEAAAALVAGQRSPIASIGYGVNDMRSKASIAGSTYGNAAQVAAAAALQAQYVTACQIICRANRNARIILLMPGAHAPTSTYFENGVTGQNCMDVYRLAWRGDSTYGVQPMDTVVNTAIGRPVSIVFDTLKHIFNNTSYAFQGTVDSPDNLHLSNTGHQVRLRMLLRLFRGAAYKTLGSRAEADAAYWKEQVVALSGIRPRDYRMVTLSGEYDSVSSVVVAGAGATYLDLDVGPTVAGDVAYGAAAGADYGTATRPCVAPGDIAIIRKASDGSLVTIPITNQPNVNQGAGTLRWANTVPDTAYSYGMLTAGDVGRIWRHRYGCSHNAIIMAETNAYGSLPALASKKSYPVAIKIATGSAITVQEIDGSSGHTITTADRLQFAGGDDTFDTGVALTGATFSTPNPGETVITLASNNWIRNSMRAGRIVYTP